MTDKQKSQIKSLYKKIETGEATRQVTKELNKDYWKLVRKEAKRIDPKATKRILEDKTMSDEDKDIALETGVLADSTYMSRAELISLEMKYVNKYSEAAIKDLDIDGRYSMAASEYIRNLKISDIKNELVPDIDENINYGQYDNVSLDTKSKEYKKLAKAYDEGHNKALAYNFKPSDVEKAIAENRRLQLEKGIRSDIEKENANSLKEFYKADKKYTKTGDERDSDGASARLLDIDTNNEISKHLSSTVKDLTVKELLSNPSDTKRWTRDYAELADTETDDLFDPLDIVNRAYDGYAKLKSSKNGISEKDAKYFESLGVDLNKMGVKVNKDKNIRTEKSASEGDIVSGSKKNHDWSSKSRSISSKDQSIMSQIKKAYSTGDEQKMIDTAELWDELSLDAQKELDSQGYVDPWLWM